MNLGFHKLYSNLGSCRARRPQDEVKELADTIDAMLERLDRSFDAQRRFVSNASHELRTPLAVNRTLLEVALGAPDAGEDLRRLDRPCWPPTSAANG